MTLCLNVPTCTSRQPRTHRKIQWINLGSWAAKKLLIHTVITKGYVSVRYRSFCHLILIHELSPPSQTLFGIHLKCFRICVGSSSIAHQAFPTHWKTVRPFEGRVQMQRSNQSLGNYDKPNFRYLYPSDKIAINTKSSSSDDVFVYNAASFRERMSAMLPSSWLAGRIGPLGVWALP